MKNDGKYSYEEALQVLSQGEVKFAKVAFRKLYDQHFGVIYRVARRVLNFNESAKDLAQEIFTTVWLKRAELAKVSNFEAYLYTMTKNLAYDHIKKMMRDGLASEEYIVRMELSDDDDSRSRIEKYDNILKLAEQLPPQPRQVFELAKVQGLSYEAIAERLKISTITVNHHMSTALKLIRKRQHEVGNLVSISLAFLGQIFDR